MRVENAGEKERLTGQESLIRKEGPRLMVGMTRPKMDDVHLNGIKINDWIQGDPGTGSRYPRLLVLCLECRSMWFLSPYWSSPRATAFMYCRDWSVPSPKLMVIV